jgi:hypothetical protein
MNKIIENLSEKEYFQLEGIHQSFLKKIYSTSVLHAYLSKEIKTKSKTNGSLVDTLIFSPDSVRENYEIIPLKADGKELNKNSTDYKQWEASIISQGKMPLSKKVLEQAERTAYKLKENPIFLEYLDTAIYKQVTLLFDDPTTGLQCVARPDGISKINGNIILWDLKTTRNINPFFFKKDIYNFGYHLQAAQYIIAMKLNGIITSLYENTPAFLVAVETSTGIMQVFKLSPSMIMEGLRAREEAIIKWKTALETKVYPGYSDDVIEVEHTPREEPISFDDDEESENDEGVF